MWFSISRKTLKDKTRLVEETIILLTNACASSTVPDVESLMSTVNVIFPGIIFAARPP